MPSRAGGLRNLSEVERLAVAKPVLPIAKRKTALWVKPSIRLRVRYLKGSDKLRHAAVSGIIANG